MGQLRHNAFKNHFPEKEIAYRKEFLSNYE